MLAQQVLWQLPALLALLLQQPPQAIQGCAGAVNDHHEDLSEHEHGYIKRQDLHLHSPMLNSVQNILIRGWCDISAGSIGIQQQGLSSAHVYMSAELRRPCKLLTQNPPAVDVYTYQGSIWCPPAESKCSQSLRRKQDMGKDINTCTVWVVHVEECERLARSSISARELQLS